VVSTTLVTRGQPVSSITIEAEARTPIMSAQLAGHHMPVPVESVLRHPRDYQINMCLTPRPLYTRASYRQHWGPHRYESLGEIFLVPPGEELHAAAAASRRR
jgi:AraC family transcriptional regulator